MRIGCDAEVGELCGRSLKWRLRLVPKSCCLRVLRYGSCQGLLGIVVLNTVVLSLISGIRGWYKPIVRTIVVLRVW